MDAANRSRLPQPRSNNALSSSSSSFSLPKPSTTTAASSLKRKLTSTTGNAAPSSSALTASASTSRLPTTNPGSVGRVTRTASGYKTSASASSSLTVPRAPGLSTSSRARGGSASAGRVVKASTAAAMGVGRRGAGSENVDPVRRVGGVRKTPPSTAVKRPALAACSSRASSSETPDEGRFAELQKEWETKWGSMTEALAGEQAKIAELLSLRQRVEEITTKAVNRRQSLASDEQVSTLKNRHARELDDLRNDHEREVEQLRRELARTRRERDDLEGDLEREREVMRTLKTTISQNSANSLTLESTVQTLKLSLSAAEQTIASHLLTISARDASLASSSALASSLEAELRQAETHRRRLHNQIQELKGNIRVFARVRPTLPRDGADAALARLDFPDSASREGGKEIRVLSDAESADGRAREQVFGFGFDRVFGPQTQQADVFEEIEGLAQSVLDGYNVCIFAYGQTGSGKSWTMEGDGTTGQPTSGMIPRAIEQVFSTTKNLADKGWSYIMEGQYLEIYNETINDLLGSAEIDKQKHNINHDAKSGRTTVSEVVNLPLETPEQVHALLSKAKKRRAVAATLMNERSSRSHSLFSLRLVGTNSITGEACEGVLNLIDLAGSERLSSSGAGADATRLRETQSINKSLSALADVISALGTPGAHVPYRNSKLTYLLQNSLNSNSKTLMFLNLSPLQAHLGESLCSLRFATKVNNTTIGTARVNKTIKASSA